MKWGFCVLAIMIIGFVGLQIYLHIDLSIFKKNIGSDSENVVEGVSPTAPSVEAGGVSVKPPPPGETVDTGHWEGNVWHQNPSPEAVKSSWWDNVLSIDKHGAGKYDKIISGEKRLPKEFYRADGTKDYHAFYRQVIAEYPNSKAAFTARLRMARGGSITTFADDLKALLKYYPDAPGINAKIAFWTATDSPEDSIAFAKKALRLPVHSLEGDLFDVTRTPQMYAHKALGRAYQRLGDYKTAMVHLKKVQNLLLTDPNWESPVKISYEAAGKNIEAIKAGKPLYGPDPVEVSEDVPEAAPDFDSLLPSDDTDLLESPASVDDFDFFEFLAEVDEDEFLSDDRPDVSGDDRRVRMREAAEQARAAFVSEQERKQREFASFLSWMEQIERVQTPADLDDFLMREMAKTLQGEDTQYEPDRLIRAYETMMRYGEMEGLTKLRERDEEMAKAMLKARPSQRVPPQRVPPRSRGQSN